MSYVNENLLPDETVVHRGEIHWFIFNPPVILLVIALITPGTVSAIFWFLTIVSFLGALIYKKTTELALTNKRVIVKLGFISRDTTELNLTKIESLNVKQDLFGRMFNYGKLIVNGTGGIKTPINGISNPLLFRKRVNEQIELQSSNIRTN